MENFERHPEVIIRRSWVVVSVSKDEEGDFMSYDEEFDDYEQAHAFAAQQAEIHGVKIKFGHAA